MEQSIPWWACWQMPYPLQVCKLCLQNQLKSTNASVHVAFCKTLCSDVQLIACASFTVSNSPQSLTDDWFCRRAIFFYHQPEHWERDKGCWEREKGGMSRSLLKLETYRALCLDCLHSMGTCFNLQDYQNELGHGRLWSKHDLWRGCSSLRRILWFWSCKIFQVL